MLVVSSQLSVVSRAKNERRSTFPFSPSRFRLGLSLTEVLIAMGILTLGLLGVASVFPVGSFYMQKAETSDRGSAIARSVMNDLMARGMLNPKAWFITIPWGWNSSPNAWNTGFQSVDGRYLPLPYSDPTKTPPVATFSRPFAEVLSAALQQANAATDKTLVGKQVGSAYVIDPLGVSMMAIPRIPSAGTRNGPAMSFPATAYNAAGYTTPNSFYFNSGLWMSWSAGSAIPSKPDYGQLWPIRRVTYRQQTTGWQLDLKMAEHYFRGNDDLVVDLPARDDRPATQKWDVNLNGSVTTPLARQWTGDYSWIVSVVPTSNAARDGMARNPEGFEYDVSVVVFYKRPLPSDATTVQGTTTNLNSYYDALGESERVVKASILSTGLNGGELLLSDIQDTVPNKTPFDGLKSGQWIMLCGPHPNSTDSEPKLVLNWYQVLSVEGKNKPLNDQGTDNPAPPPADPQRRLVTVRGPQWPWQPKLSYPTAQQSSDVAKQSDELCVAICRGAVAVHTKTMRLEGNNSTWSVPAGGSGAGNGGFGGGGGPNNSPPPFIPF
jgi:hypothetical protein